MSAEPFDPTLVRKQIAVLEGALSNSDNSLDRAPLQEQLELRRDQLRQHYRRVALRERGAAA